MQFSSSIGTPTVFDMIFVTGEPQKLKIIVQMKGQLVLERNTDGDKILYNLLDRINTVGNFGCGLFKQLRRPQMCITVAENPHFIVKIALAFYV